MTSSHYYNTAHPLPINTPTFTGRYEWQYPYARARAPLSRCAEICTHSPTLTPSRWLAAPNTEAAEPHRQSLPLPGDTSWAGGWILARSRHIRANDAARRSVTQRGTLFAHPAGFSDILSLHRPLFAGRCSECHIEPHSDRYMS